MVQGDAPPFGTLFRGYRRWATLIGISLLRTLLLSIGTLLLIVPGILWALSFAFASIVVLDQRSLDAATPKVGVIDAMEHSKDLASGHRGMLFGISLLLSIPPVIALTLVMLTRYAPGVNIPLWVLELVTILGGTLFLGPLHAASYMVAYDAIVQSKGPATQPSASSTNSIPSGK